MFEEIVSAPKKSSRKTMWAVASAVLHLGIGAAVVVMSFWEIQELSRPNLGVAMATSLPAASSGSSSSAPAKKLQPKVKKRVVRETRQLRERAPDEVPTETSNGAQGAGDGTGTGNGEGDGNGNGGPGIGTGLGIGDLCLDVTNCDGEIPEVKVEKVETLPPTILSKLKRVSGNSQVQPPTSTRNAMHRKAQTRAVAVVKMCLDKSGSVSSQKLITSSGYPEYDQKILSSVRRWSYEPYRANGVAIALCTHVTFIYLQE